MDDPGMSGFKTGLEGGFDFFFFNRLPMSTLFIVLKISHLSASIGKMPIFMTYLAFEGDLLVIQLLNVTSVIHL